MDGRDIAEHEEKNFCPDGRDGGDLVPGGMPGGSQWQTRGPELWAELHRWAMVADLSQVTQWLAGFAERLDCGECRTHWLAWVGEHVPAAADHRSLLRWTIAGHNAVKVRLGKAERDVEEMANYWGLNGL